MSDSSKCRLLGKLGAERPITRRDFLGTAMLGSGAALLWQAAPQAMGNPEPTLDLSPSGSPWTGYGGVGDYAWANGDTMEVWEAAHEIRDGVHDEFSELPVPDSFDLVIVGGGFSGMSAAWEFAQRRKDGQTCLLLDNHALFGGEAKQNTFNVNGTLLSAPQGSNEAIVPPRPGPDTEERMRLYSRNWYDLGLPDAVQFQDRIERIGNLRIPHSHYRPMLDENAYDVGYFFAGGNGQAGQWAVNPMAQGFANTPLSERVCKDFDDMAQNRRDAVAGRDDYDRWLDTITYKHLLEDELGYGPEVTAYMDPLVAVGNYGVACDGISAYAAAKLTFPGTIPKGTLSRFIGFPTFTFEGGNTAVLRHFAKALVPRCISGGRNFHDIATGRVNFGALDVPGNPVRIRLNSTAVRVEHEGEPGQADSVLVTYTQGGRTKRVRARGVVMACGGWVSRRVVRDLGEKHATAFARLSHGPVLCINVALTNWRFMEKLGIAAARWFEGLGWHTTLRTYVAGPPGSRAEPLNPDRPTVLTLYVPFLHHGHDTRTQGILGRNELLSKPYADFELEVRQQFEAMFGGYGFDVRKDIAGIILNRWGHAYVSPEPGFFFGKGGEPAPPDVIREPFGRIAFAHSELGGNQNMIHAMQEGERAVGQLISKVL